MRFALFFGNRGFFPGELVAAARRELCGAVERAGHEWIAMDESATKYGAVELVPDGEKYAAFLAENRGNYDGVILCLPNFGDENGAVTALRDCGVPILIQAYPDEIGKMDFSRRRDAFCGKFSIMDVFTQYGLPFTAFPPHVCRPSSREFSEQLDTFARVCRVVKGMRRFSVGAIGARTTAFKTVRYDELTLQKYGVTVDTFDLSEVFHRAEAKKNDAGLEALIGEFSSFTDCSKVPREKLRLMAATCLAIRDLAAEYRLDTLAIRCWNEFPQIFGISVCAVVGYLNHLGVPCACELDVCNAVAMRALSLASASPAACLDWNNNYGEAANKCVLFHCGPLAPELMEGKGRVGEHKMFAKSYGAGCAFGVNEGRIKPGAFTYASGKTVEGKFSLYLGEGKFTGDPIEPEFFGCGGVAEIPNLENVLLYVGKTGYRHHVSVAPGKVAGVLSEALGNYLGYELKVFE